MRIFKKLFDVKRNADVKVPNRNRQDQIHESFSMRDYAMTFALHHQNFPR